MKIKIATWNVNSIKARLEGFLLWLKASTPDVVLLQEIKTISETFPKEPIADLGYNMAIFGQKTYNGVAILSKYPIEDIIENLPNFSDQQSRYIEALISLPNSAFRVASVYVPNGGSELHDGQKINETAKFQYKMNFFDKLSEHAKKRLELNEAFIIGGDFNVANENIDVHDANSLKNTLCFHDNEKAKFRKLLNMGYGDLFRNLNPYDSNFSWWDYRGNSLKLNKGMRIDYLLAPPSAMDIAVSCSIDNKALEVEKRSYHAPVICELKS